MSVVTTVAEKLKVDIEQVTAEVIEIMDNPIGESIIDRVLTYSAILKEGNWSPKQYLKAVEYVSYKLADFTQVESWKMTFPERAITAKGDTKPMGTIRSLASTYDRGDLVQKIMTQVQIPLHMLMMGERVTAAGVLARLMVHGETERIQMEAADKLLYHIKPPEALKIEADISFRADDTINELNDKLTALADFAANKIETGQMTPIDVIES